MTTIVDLDTGQVLGIVDGRDSDGVGEWLFARPLQWRLGVQVVAIDPSAAFRKALRMWLPRTAVSVDAFHLVKLGNDMLTEVRQRLTQQVHGRRGRSPRRRRRLPGGRHQLHQLEEACSQVPAWIKQRTRWIKGYMVTAAVNTRNTLRYVQRTGVAGAVGSWA